MTDTSDTADTVGAEAIATTDTVKHCDGAPPHSKVVAHRPTYICKRIASFSQSLLARVIDSQGQK